VTSDNNTGGRHGGAPERVVQQDEVAVVVGRAGQAHALALAARQVNAALARHGLVTLGQNLKVKLESARVDHLENIIAGIRRG
jgi:hypothetical protein